MTDARGKAVAGALAALETTDSDLLLLSRYGVPWGHAPESKSDAHGVVVWEHLALGTYDITLQAAGFAPLRLPGVVVKVPKPPARVSDFGTVRLSPGAVLDGIVVDLAGKPLAGVEVYSSARGFDGEPAALTDAGGRFRLVDLTAGKPVDLLARAAGWSDSRLSRVAVPSEAQVRLVMAPRVHIRGRVLDDQSRPLGDARIDLEAGDQTGASTESWGGPWVARSGSDGAFDLADVPTGAYDLFASLTGFLAAEVGDIQVLPGKDVDGLEVVLRAGGAVHGTVYDYDGTPLPGISVSAGVSPSGTTTGVPAVDTTDGDGHYRLPAVAPGHATVSAAKPEGGRTARELDVKPGENELDLRFQGGVEVSGTVVDDRGGPVGGAHVALSSTSRSGGGEGKRTETATDGRFAFKDVHDGEYRMVAWSDGYAQTNLPAFTVAGVAMTGLEVRLQKGGRIVGALRGLNLIEIAALRIIAKRVGDPGPWLQGVVDPAGRYSIANVPAGLWSVDANVHGGRRANGRVTVPETFGDSVLDLEFGKGLTLTGHVIRGGVPLGDASVYVMGQSVAARLSADTTSDGKFRLEGLAAGTYTVSVLAHGSSWSDSLDLEDDRDIEIAFGVGSLHGRVLDAEDGSPLAGVTLTLESAVPDASHMRNLFTSRARSDAQGQFRIGDLSAGSWTLRGSLAGYAATTAVATIDDGQDAETDIRMQATEGLVLQVATPAGPAATVQAAVLDGGGGVVSIGRFQATDTGRVRIQNVPQGSYEVLLAADGTAVADIRAVAAGPATPVRLQAGARVVVHVADLDSDSTVATVSLTDGAGHVFRSPNSSVVLSTWSLAHGRASIEGVPAGSWTVQVTGSDGQRWSAAVNVHAGSEVVVEPQPQ
ncbi:MAG: carboxypeptidase-like regulatory domain-containing protein [Acidobacteriota bacterium]